MFDFDGTVALVRAGWMPVMLDLMMETLAPLSSRPDQARSEAEEYVARFTGKDTIHQMAAFAEHVSALGGSPIDPVEHKSRFLRRIEAVRVLRLSRLQGDELLVPGTRALLTSLRARGIATYLASGTAHADVVHESRLLGISHFFDEIHGSSPETLTKAGLLGRLIADGIDPREIVTFGDGCVEIEETRIVGGTAVGVATCEAGCHAVDPKKRRWLLEAGADYIIPNFLDPEIMRIVEGTL